MRSALLTEAFLLLLERNSKCRTHLFLGRTAMLDYYNLSTRSSCTQCKLPITVFTSQQGQIVCWQLLLLHLSYEKCNFPDVWKNCTKPVATIQLEKKGFSLFLSKNTQTDFNGLYFMPKLCILLTHLDLSPKTLSCRAQQS